jgi:hypothetical protein
VGRRRASSDERGVHVADDSHGDEEDVICLAET